MLCGIFNLVLSAVLVFEGMSSIAKARSLKGKLEKLDKELTPEAEELPQALARHNNKSDKAEHRTPIYIDGLTGEAYY